MKEVISTLAFFLLLAALGLFFYSLYKPKFSFNKKFLKTTSRKRLSIYYLSVAVLAIVLGTATATPQETSTQNTDPNQSVTAETTAEDQTPTEAKEVSEISAEAYEVVEVIDGDTIDIKLDGKTERLRLIGMDTPETSDPRKPVQCFGKEASNKAKGMLQGKKVKIEADSTQDNRDKYDRLLRYVYLEDGTSYNEYMIANGYAHEYTYEIPYKYQQKYKDAQKKAEGSSAGFWSSSTCSGDTEQAATTPKQQSTPKPQATAPTGSNCDPNYTPCVPNVSYDLDCGDIGFRVTIIGTDVHKLDGSDGDGLGCESY